MHMCEHFSSNEEINVWKSKHCLLFSVNVLMLETAINTLRRAEQ